MLRFTADARSEAGLVRPGNEDSGFVSSTLLLVADGVGGNAGGEVASATTAWTFARQSRERVGLRPSGVLDQAGHESRRLLSDGVRDHPDLTGMATTLTALLTDGHRCALAHVGDSRAYQLRGTEIRQVSTDHTWVQDAVVAGELTEEQAEQHPWRHVVVRSIGAEQPHGPDVTPLVVRPGDRIVLCSDGLSDLVEDHRLAELLRAHPREHAADALLRDALASGAPDNVSVVVADVVDVSAGAAGARAPEVGSGTTVGAAAVLRG